MIKEFLLWPITIFYRFLDLINTPISGLTLLNITEITFYFSLIGSLVFIIRLILVSLFDSKEDEIDYYNP